MPKYPRTTELRRGGRGVVADRGIRKRREGVKDADVLDSVQEDLQVRAEIQSWVPVQDGLFTLFRAGLVLVVVEPDVVRERVDRAAAAEKAPGPVHAHETDLLWDGRGICARTLARHS